MVLAPIAEKYWVDRSNAIDVLLDSSTNIAPHARHNGRDVRILLPRDSILQKIAGYPAAVEENLAEVLANDLDRQSPFTPDQVYLAHRVDRRYIGQDEATRIDVELTIVLRRVADAAIEQVRANGGRVYSLGIAGDSHQVELLPQAARPARRLSRLQKINIALLAGLGVLIVIALVTPIVIKRSEIKALVPLVDKARIEAEATRKVESEFQRLHQEYQVAVGKKYATFQAIDIVEELTRLSPDTTWLQNFEMKVAAGSTKGAVTKPPTREIQIIGEAASASKMIELLEQSRLLQNTTQRALTTRGSQPNTERFQIATEVKPRAAPALIDLFNLVDKPAALAPNPLPTAVATQANILPAAAVPATVTPAPMASPAGQLRPPTMPAKPAVTP